MKSLSSTITYRPLYIYICICIRIIGNVICNNVRWHIDFKNVGLEVEYTISWRYYILSLSRKA